MSDGVLRVVLDADAFDDLAASAAIHEAVDDGRLVLYCTLVQAAQAFDPRAPDDVRRCRSTLRYVPIPAGTFVLASEPGAISGGRLNVDRLPNADSHAAYERVKIDNLAHVPDAILTATAKADRLPIVSRDKALRRKCATLGIDVLHPTELIARLDAAP